MVTVQINSLTIYVAKSEYKDLLVKDFLNLIKDRIRYDEKLTICHSTRFYAQPEESFSLWLDGEAVVWAEKINIRIRLQVNEQVRFLERHNMLLFSSSEDLIPFLRTTGDIPENHTIIDIDIEEKGGILVYSDRFFNSNYNNYIRIWTRPPLRKKKPPASRVAETHARLQSQDPTCLICHEDMLAVNLGDLSKISVCAHHFHTKCLEDWILSSPSCPLCRAVL